MCSLFLFVIESRLYLLYLLRVTSLGPFGAAVGVLTQTNAIKYEEVPGSEMSAY